MRPPADRAWLRPERVGSVADRSLAVTEADALASAVALLVDPTRLRMLHALAWADELCVFDLSLLLDLAQSTVSRQLRLLRERGVVTRRKDGRLTYYRLTEPSLRRFLRAFDERLRSPGVNFEASPWSLLCPEASGPVSLSPEPGW
ncbi:MAG: metalloregulator ArsR/SmtB family transcription factor [Chloroflexi bacterium]|nr:metalloregulator ArsR/SmtB family transcription factor [Chloroflexota bacterium]